jgi:uncharacterized protein (TIGR03437 family)
MQNFKLLAGSFLTALILFPALCLAQNISIVSGNGQLVCPNCEVGLKTYVPLVVQVNDATGKPSVNTTVTWTATQLGYPPTVSTTVTNSSGQASYNFTPLAFFFGADFLPANIVASALSKSVTFVETTGQPSANSPTAPINVNLVPQEAPPALTGTAGSTGSTPFTITVLGIFFEPIPGVQVRMQSGSSSQPNVSCATQSGQPAGTVLTDNTGTAICTPVFGNVTGTGSYILVVGNGYVSIGPAPLNVTGGAPATIKIISGDKQNVNPGTTTGAPLTAEVTDLGGNPSSGAAVKWAVTSGTATLVSPVNTSASNGQVTAKVTPTIGPVQVTVSLASNSKASAVFTVNVNIVATGMQLTSGDQQEANQNQAFAGALIVQVNDNNAPVQGATVNYVVNSGSVTLSASSAVTNAQGQAQVTATAGPTAGPAVVTASVKSGNVTFSQTFHLTVSPPGATITAVTNAASYQSQFVAPCSLATVFGTGLTPGLQGVVTAFIGPQTQVANITVAFGGVLAPILAVANVNGQQSVSIQVPCEVPTGTAQMVVTVAGTPSAAFPVTISTVAPGIFQTTMSDATVRAVLVRQDGTFVSLENPARRGDNLRMFVTGLGQTTPALFTNEFDPQVVVDGNLVPQALPVNASMVVGVNNGGVTVTWAGYAYGMVGVYEVDFQVPQDTATGNNIPFAIAVYQGTNLVFGNGSLIPIQ